MVASFTGSFVPIDRPDTVQLQAEARQAAMDAATGAQNAGSPVEAEFFRRAAADVDKVTADASNFWRSSGLDISSLIPGGMATVAIIGGLALLYFVGRK